MKYLIISIIFILSIHAGEVDRIEAIVQDIEDLREKYNLCKQELNSKTAQTIIPQIDVSNSNKASLKAKDETIKKYIRLLNKEKKKNKLLSEKLDSFEIPKKDEKTEKLVNNLKNLLLIKEKEINNLENKVSVLKNEKLIIAKSKDINTNNILCKDENKFPKLVMKTKKETKTKVFKEKTESKTHTKAFAFRVTTKSDIYDSIDGKVVKTWEEKTSFTSNVIHEKWVKITGYFIDAKWVKAEEELWIKKINTIKR
ncbi:hypothetical protein [Sulfurimonas sp.]